ncbi:MAG: SPOR domain-containing protein [Candidatus Thiodiazotropha sp.]
MSLDERLKQRLLGGAVLVALIVIFVPMLIEEPVDQQIVSDHSLPVKPLPFRVEPRNPQPAPETPRPVEPPVAVAAPAPKPKPAEPVAPPETPVDVKPAVSASQNAKPPVDDATRPSPSAWMIQVVSLTREDNARKLVEDLRKASLPAQLETARVDGKTHYRVRVGPEVDHRLAQQMVEKIKKEFKLKPKLMRYP